MSKKKTKHRVLRSGVAAPRGIYNKGVGGTVVFMAIIATTYRNWTKRGGMSNNDKLELEVVFNCCKKVLIQYFKVSEKKIKEIWGKLPSNYVQKEANILYANMSRKIILAGDKRTAGGVIIPDSGMDLSKIAKEVKNGRQGKKEKV